VYNPDELQKLLWTKIHSLNTVICNPEIEPKVAKKLKTKLSTFELRLIEMFPEVRWSSGAAYPEVLALSCLKSFTVIAFVIRTPEGYSKRPKTKYTRKYFTDVALQYMFRLNTKCCARHPVLTSYGETFSPSSRELHSAEWSDFRHY